MATGDKYLSCGSGKVLTATSELEEILSALLVKGTTGSKVGFRYVTSTVSGDDLTPVVPCGQPNLALVDILRNALVEDANGDPAIGLILPT